MAQAGTTTTDVQKALGFLRGLPNKASQLERDIGRLESAVSSPDLYRGRWPTEALERGVRPLVTADSEHGFDSLAAWGRQVLGRLEAIHRRVEAPAAEDIDWLRTRLRELRSLAGEETIEAERRLAKTSRDARRALEPTPAEGVTARQSLRPERNPLSNMPPGPGVDELLDPLTQHMVTDEDISRLAGRSALVADDEAEVRALFERTLGRAGMTVRSVEDGQAALLAIKDNPPDVLITDILMPRLDGWELTGRLRRDFGARHIPTIILSWKEDLLDRVRDLKAGASGYMLKESDRKQILYTVARALLPRLTLEKRLLEDDEVTGRVERVGVLPLLAAAMQHRPSCRVHLTEHWNFYEAHIVDGELLAVTRTATDGSFSSGTKALERLVGVTTGRFAVVPPAPNPPKRQFEGGAWNAIGLAADRLTSLVSRLVEGGLGHGTRIVLDDEEATAYSRILPPSAGALLAKLRAGEALRDIVLSSDTPSDVLETLVVDLVRCGVIADVHYEAGSTLPPLPEPPKRESAVTVPLSAEELVELVPAPKEPGPVSTPGDAAELMHKMHFYRGMALVLLVLCLSLAGALAMSMYQALESRSAPTPAPSAMIPPPPAATHAPPRPAVSKPVTTSPEAPPDKPRLAPSPASRPKEPLPSPLADEPAAALPVDNSAGTLSVSAAAGQTAEVLVDGARVGQTPLEVSLTKGIHEVRLVLPHKTFLHMVSIKAGETKQLKAE